MEMEKVVEVEVIKPLTLENSGHALDNALVLCQIFMELARWGSVQDLKNARLVTNAKNWQAELRKVWRQEAVLVLYENKTSEGRGIILNDFYEELHDPNSPYRLEETPYERVKLQNMEITILSGIEAPIDEKVWNVLSPSVKRLALRNVQVGIMPMQSPIQFLNTKLPNLESLCLHEVELPILWTLFKMNCPAVGDQATLDKVTSLHWGGGGLLGLKFCNLPKLQELKLSGYTQLAPLLMPTTLTDDWEDELDYVEVPNVKKIDLVNCKKSAGPKSKFSELEHLTLNIYGDMAHFHFSVFIQTHSDTLKTLELYRSLVYSPLEDLIYGKFPVLKTLRLWGNVMFDLCFLRFMPNLQHLHWDVNGYEKQERIKDDINMRYGDAKPLDLVKDYDMTAYVKERGWMTGVEMTKLEYCHLDYHVTTENVRNLAEWMPNLKTFNAVLDSEGFREVCSQWEDLEHLSCLFGSKITDQDIAPPESNFKGLTDLKNLKSFSFYPECNASTLSDACVTGGFLLLTQLSKLHIFVSAEFSEASEQLLCERIHNLKIYRHSPDEKLDCCKTMEYRKLIFGEEKDSEENLLEAEAWLI